MHVLLWASPSARSRLAYFSWVLPLSEPLRDLGSGPLAVSSSLLCFSVNCPSLQTSPKAIVWQHPSRDGSGSREKKSNLLSCSPDIQPFQLCMSEVLKGCKTLEVGSGVPSPPIVHPPWCFIMVLGWICHSLGETEGENDLQKPNQGCTKITFLAVLVLEAQPLWWSIWGSTAMHLSSSGILPQGIPAAVPWDRTVEWEDTCSGNLWPFFMDQMKPWSKAAQCPSDTELSEWLWASSGVDSSPDSEVSPGNSPLKYP